MEEQKIIRINFSGSFVNTTEAFAWVILLLGVAGAFYIGSETLSMITALATFFSSFMIFFLLLALSKLLKHVFYIRKIQEAKAEKEGFVITEKKSDFEY